MKQFFQRSLATFLSAGILMGLCTTVSAAFQYPDSYWTAYKNWQAAQNTKDPARIISAAQELYDSLIPCGLCDEVCELQAICAPAAWCSEISGDIDGAITWLERRRELLTWRMEHGGPDYTDFIITVDAQLMYLKTAREPVVYALTDQPGKTLAAGPTSGTWFGTAVTKDTLGESAHLVYVDFMDGQTVDHWINYYKVQSKSFTEAVENGGVIELAWNYSPESTAGVQKILNSSSDSYISESLATLGDLNATVLLRIGAEMNVWTDCDREMYKQAFQKIAQEARRYPNIQTVFSPVVIGRWNESFEEFYPGNDYVDWIGVSDYQTSNYATYSNGPAKGSYSLDITNAGADAFYGYGVYDSDPLVSLQPFATFAEDHGKPLMISECGFAYQYEQADQTTYAVDQLNKFYSYVNMIYPQVKAVFFFNTSIPGEPGKYDAAGSPAIAAAYKNAIQKNGGYLTAGQTKAKSWHPLVESGSASGDLKLATYSILPGLEPTTVTYYIDGAAVNTSTQAPYYYDLNLNALGSETHTFYVEATSGQFKRVSPTYTIQAGKAPVVTSSDSVPLPDDGSQTAYASTQSVDVDGKKVNFEMYALKDPTTGYLTNYVKARDVAQVLNGSKAQFSVGWDGVMNLTSGASYTPNGSEMSTPFTGDRPYTLPTSPTNVNGTVSNLEAIVLTDDQGGGFTYYKLRDLGQALGFNVGWSQEKGVFIETNQPYKG